MINFHPKKGTILCCDFSKGFQPPEMVKVRPVMVVTPKLPGRPGLCTVVPLSSVKPAPMQAYHHKMDPESLTSKMQPSECWAKCDMLYTVGLGRLDRLLDGKNADGKRIYTTSMATEDDLEAVEKAILQGLGLRKFLK